MYFLGRKAIHFAAYNGDVEVAKLLVQKGREYVTMATLTPLQKLKLILEIKKAVTHFIGQLITEKKPLLIGYWRMVQK